MRNVRDPMKKFMNYKDIYPYKQLLPPALKDQVSGKGDRKKQLVCQQELSQVLVCLKKYDFDQGRCSKEIGDFMACNKLHEKARREVVDEMKSTDGRLSTDLVNKFLNLYPQNSYKKK